MADKNGKLHDAATSDDEQARMREREARAWATVERIQERNAHISPEQVLAEVTAEVEAHRQEEHERRAGTETSRR